MVQVKWRKAALKDLYPNSYPPEPLLRGKRRRYRGAHLLGRFEVIYYYSPKSQCVYVVRLWDMRRNPDLLLRELK